MAKEKVQDEFTQFANEVAQKEKEEAETRAARAAGGGTNFQSYEKIKWTGLEKGKQKILRALGGVPNSGRDAYTARSVRIANIKADDGKTIKIRYPIDPLEAESWILTRIIERVTAADWIKGPDGKNVKVYVQEKKNPDIFDMVDHNGLEASDTKRKFGPEGKGWWGRVMFLMNVIDREPTHYQWSKENKHSMLLSKNINAVQAKDGSGIIEFADDGVPEYGFTSLLSRNLFKSYGNWENYDISIERTGQTNPPMNVVNAVKHLEEVAEELQDFVVDGPLTDEEKSWERYDLNKLFGTTSYTKLYDRLKLSIAKIDAALGSHYLTELESLKKDEQAKRDAENAARAAVESTEDSTSESAPVPHDLDEVVPPSTSELAPGALAKLSNVAAATIISYVMTDPVKGTWKIEYNVDEKQYACPRCGTNAPASFELCPSCGFSF